MRISVALLCLSLLSIPLSSRAQWSPTLRKGIEVNYGGKYLEHPFYKQMMAQMPALRAKAVALVNKTLGTRYKDDFSIILRFVDATDETDVSRENDMKKSGKPNLKSRGRTGEYMLAGKPVVAITFYLEHFVSGSADYRTTVIHEFSHGIMRKLMPSDKIRAGIPGWFKEGLATLLAGQGPGRVRKTLASSSKKEPTASLKGLRKLADGKKPSGTYYFEYYLHADFIGSANGSKGLAAFYAMLAKGKPFNEAVAKVTGLAYPEFVTASDVRAQVMFDELAEKNGRKAYRNAIKAAADGASEKLEAFLEKRPNSIFAGPVKMELARFWLKAKKNARAAAKLLRDVADHHMGDFNGARDVKLFLGKALLRSKDAAGAVVVLDEYLRDMVSVKKAQRAKATTLRALAAERAEPGDEPIGDPAQAAEDETETPAHE